MGRTKGSTNKSKTPPVDKSIGGHQPAVGIDTPAPDSGQSGVPDKATETLSSTAEIKPIGENGGNENHFLPVDELPGYPNGLAFPVSRETEPATYNTYSGDLSTGFSQAFTDDNIKYDHLHEDYINHGRLKQIEEAYQSACDTPSDINELLPYLRAVAEQCSHITEFGVRKPTSTWAFLITNPEKLVSYDIERYPEIDMIVELATNFEFVQMDVLEADIEETDFLFIDTYHTATQLERELAKHADKVLKYLGFHDVHTFGHRGEPWYPGIPQDRACGRGLWEALNPFLNRNPEWKIDFKTNQNNGLLILKRV